MSKGRAQNKNLKRYGAFCHAKAIPQPIPDGFAAYSKRRKLKYMASLKALYGPTISTEADPNEDDETRLSK